MCLINNDFIPKVHSLAIPIFPVHFNHLANIKIPWSSNNMRRFTFSTAVKKDKKQSPMVFRFHGFPGELKRGCRRCGVSIPEDKSSISIVFIFFLWRGREGAVTYVHLWMKPSHTMQCNGLLTLTWQNLPTFGTLRARWLSLPQTRSCSQSCAEIEAAAEFQVKQEHNWKCDRYIHIVAMFF